jgi:phosphoenolpyruvate synthase/pyruvate phosphate dikinase
VDAARELPGFDRRFLESTEAISRIGSGALGGKAQGLLAAREVLAARFPAGGGSPIGVGVPRLAVVASGVFDAFLERNRLAELALSDAPDPAIARAFQQAELPAEVVGDLWSLMGQLRVPLAVRSSSLLEDALRHPFAGVYTTKMIPNSAQEPAARFARLCEAVKLVYASTFFRGAKAYVRAAGRDIAEEKMAVILQEVVGRRHGPRFYPEVSAVARSYNFYPTGSARPEEGVANLALGLGKTIVEGGRSWTCSPAHPLAPPPLSTDELVEQTQTDFWAVNMGPPPPHDPIAEAEYLVRPGMAEA